MKRKSSKPLLPEEVFKYDSGVDKSTIRKALKRYKLLELICANLDCPTRQMSDWCGKEIPYQVDHINGDSKDHRLENLRYLCGICHTQTETFGLGARRLAIPKKIKYCAICNIQIYYRSKLYCIKCKHIGTAAFALNSMTIEEMFKVLEKASLEDLANKYNTTVGHLKRVIREKFGPGWNKLFKIGRYKS